ncbi:exodeoxyribonuclease V subunit alpha [Marinobacter sp. X15-166B]|nr:exodeoxyribonuclease V subunit alpha [Marinobacter sp. X15-166B]
MGWLRSLDAALVRFLDQQSREADAPAPPLLLLAIALASHQLGRGHVCLDLMLMEASGFNDSLSLPPEDESAPDRRLLPSDVLAEVTGADWEHALTHDLLVADGTLPTPDSANTPLVRKGLRLYLRRYWNYEQQVFARMTARLNALPAMVAADSARSRQLQQVLARLFPSLPADAGPDWQRIACASAARHQFSIITGGPGTGKTTTVIKLLAALQSVTLDTHQGRPLRIRLAAPTGKAAARLNESITGAVAGLNLEGLADAARLRTAIPTEVTTLHRLLGSIPGSRQFRHHRDNPLVVDVLVVDEASMVDLEMMARMLDALPAQSRLILLGDKDQLASVDAGAVLGELCQRAAQGHYTRGTADWLEEITGCRLPEKFVDARGMALDQAVTMLRTSHRFGADSGIGKLSQTVNQASAATVAQQVRDVLSAGYADLAYVALPYAAATAVISQHCLSGGAGRFPNGGENRVSAQGAIDAPCGYRHYLTTMKNTRPLLSAPKRDWDAWGAAVLKAYNHFQLLTALRRGPYGVEGLNQTVIEALYRARLIPQTTGWFPGRPVLVTRNDYSLGLMNGDIGIALKIPAWQWVDGHPVVRDDSEVIRVAFPAGDGSGGVRWVLPSRLHSVETVYAMTVHKSQGSEFIHTCMVLPERINPVLTRELVYTGITRARYWFSLLVADNRVLDQALARTVNRTSGLGELMFGGASAQ